MPALANVTVKKNDGTTDIIYTGISPSSGDGVPAMYRQEDVTVPPAGRAVLRVSAKSNGNGSVRRLNVDGVRPQVYTETTTGLKKIANRATMTVSFGLPQEMPSTDIDEFVSQFVNFMASAHFKDCVKTGMAAT